jgi:hypothetical protein
MRLPIPRGGEGALITLLALLRKRGTPLCPAFWAIVLMMPTTGLSLGKMDTEQWLKEAEESYSRVTNYTAVFHKQQRIDGKLTQEETMLMKFKSPFSLYLSWIEEPHKGSELLYVEGWNSNLARVHRGGLLGFVTRNIGPLHPALMENNLRPFTDIGLGFIVKAVASNVHRASKVGELSLFEHGEETLHDRKTQRLEIVFPRNKEKGYDAYRVIINQDLESKLLVRVRMYDWDDQLFESYGYDDIKLDASLTEADFAPNNPAYRF